MGYLRRKARDRYKTSAELDRTLAEASQFYAQMRRKVAEEDGLDPDQAAINPELAKLKERYGDELPGEITGLTAQQVLARMAEEEDGLDEEVGEGVGKVEAPKVKTGRKALTPRSRPDGPDDLPVKIGHAPRSGAKPSRKANKTARTVPSPPMRKRPAKGSPGRLVTLELPEGLLASIDEQIEAGEYSSIDDLVKEAVREKLRALRK